MVKKNGILFKKIVLFSSVRVRTSRNQNWFVETRTNGVALLLRISLIRQNLIPMNKPLHQFFTENHQRIDQLLDKATAKPEEIELGYYHQFRTQLLRHIKMEEKILFPAAKRADLTVAQNIIPRYRLEHGAITALMVLPPTPLLLGVIQYLLEIHDTAEEEPGGLYDVCEELTHGQTEELLAQLRTTEEVPVHPPNPAPIAIESARRALARAGYDFDDIIKRITS